MVDDCIKPRERTDLRCNRWGRRCPAFRYDSHGVSSVEQNPSRARINNDMVKQVTEGGQGRDQRETCDAAPDNENMLSIGRYSFARIWKAEPSRSPVESGKCGCLWAVGIGHESAIEEQ